MAEVLIEVDIKKIMMNPHQPRQEFGEEELHELALSIREVGLIHPPTVRWNDDVQKYEIISGERRFRACQLVGFDKLPVVVKRSDEEHTAKAALIENIQRVDLNPIEIAEGVQKLKEMGCTQEELSKKLGKKRSTIANYLRLLDLPISVQKRVRKGELSMGLAKAILSLTHAHEQEMWADLIIKEGWTVRQAEEKIGQIKNQGKKKKRESSPDFHLAALASKMQQKIGSKVSIQGTNRRGKVVIDYYSTEDLEHLLAWLGEDE